MGYTGYTSKRPRSILVIVGGLVATFSLVFGAFFATPQLHYALTMDPTPVEMTWQELVENGLTDNAHVRLTDVAMLSENPLDGFDGLPGLDQREQQAMFLQTFAGEKSPLIVAPTGDAANSVTTPARIVVPYFVSSIESAYEETLTSGTLTGRFTLVKSNDSANEFADMLLAARSGDLSGFSNGMGLGDESDGDKNGLDAMADDVGSIEVEDGAELASDETNATEPSQEQSQYVFEPIHSVASPQQAIQWFVLSALGVALGLVVCGAGGPSILCCFFFQGPSLLSLLGFPMRYGRPGLITRFIYAAIGISLVSYGYEQLTVTGRIDQLDGDLAYCVLGYLAVSVGSAALLGVIVSLAAQKLSTSTKPKTTTANKPNSKMSYAQACGMEADDAIGTRRYVQKQLSISDRSPSGRVNEAAEKLVKVGFSVPKTLTGRSAEGVSIGSVQLGCQDMVVVETEDTDDELQMRMISILEDGLTLITLSPGRCSVAEKRLGTSGYYSVCPSDDPEVLFSFHLEQTVSMAEKRKTVIVSFDEAELTDVCEFANRIFADIQTQYGEAYFEIGDARHGRFRYPPQPIRQEKSKAS
ncbi:hypothetical protein [Rubripirellula reticaptiva]|uniref:Uncharacterized protein n=1 Tax=Rubripirellula reticaptiva TaxID=2528013 RepID=A0A5C6EU58_9BACT|nr:hypothetical protein [Rubripirellula reticaptiva]TWU51830.1 hypothetical protein Poly59_34250 [Rubripirellula reticaptiva]